MNSFDRHLYLALAIPLLPAVVFAQSTTAPAPAPSQTPHASVSYVPATSAPAPLPAPILEAQQLLRTEVFRSGGRLQRHSQFGSQFGACLHRALPRFYLKHIALL